MRFFLLAALSLGHLTPTVAGIKTFVAGEKKYFQLNLFGFYAGYKPSIPFSIAIELSFVNIISVLLK
jgi:hypothetical protein